MPIVVDRLWLYPVKGMTAHPLDALRLDPGSGVPGDRRFAIALGRTTFDAAGRIQQVNQFNCILTLLFPDVEIDRKVLILMFL